MIASSEVGVISDGVDNRASAIASGDLPSSITIHPTFSGSDDEGTAMLEIVHDLAPGAELFFGGPNTSLEMIAVIDWMSNTADCDIICDDLGFFTKPYFEDGDVALKVREVVNVNDTLYVSSVGNYAGSHYQGEFVDSGSSIPVEGSDRPLHDFKEGSGVDTALNFFVPAGEEIRVYLQWNDPFGGSSNNYDMLLDDGNLILDSSEAPQDGSDDPLEMVSWINDTGVDTQVFVSILKFAGIAKTLELFAFGGGVIAVDDDATTGDSIFGHKAVEEAISVAAIDSFDAGLDTIETFSSRGPSTIDFPSFEIRQTPFITAVDGVSVTGAGGFPNTFFGTSAAAPHVAAICALMLEKNPSLSPAEIMAHLAAFSDDRGANRFDSTFGYGLIDALAAVQSVPLLSSTVTLNPTRDATIFSENGSEANGSGNLFVGRILPGDFRRALLFFDIVNGDGQNSGVPAGATIDSVTLTLDVSKSAGGTASTSLEKLTRDWNEGPAGNVGSGGGQGDAAGPSDVTWTQTGNGENWTTPGGDRSGSVSATHTIISNSPEWSSTQMAMDVQDWLDSPSMNFGWILIGNEQAGSRNARRFGSKETGTAPQLLIDFTPGALPTTFTVNTNDDIDDGVCDATHCSLREAIKIANANLPDSTITFDSGLAGGTITLNGTQLPEILSDLTITGLGTNLLTVDGGNQSRIFQIGTGVNVELSNLSLLGGPYPKSY